VKVEFSEFMRRSGLCNAASSVIKEKIFYVIVQKEYILPCRCHGRPQL